MPSWPASLPQNFLAEGFSIRAPDNLIRSNNDVGPAKLRRRSTSAVTEISGTLRMSEAQWSMFQAFYETDLAYGAVSFDWVDPIDQVTAKEFRIRDHNLSTNGASNFVRLDLEMLP